MADLAETWNVNIKSDNFYNHKYNNHAHEQSRYFVNNYEHQKLQPKNRIVLVNEKQLFEGIVAGFSVAMSSIILFKSGLTTKAFRRVSYDWLEVKVILGIMFGWMVVWCFRKTSNVFYDKYIAVNGRKNPYEIAINRY
tara:strand:- start:208 stop:621 length:414 start_codon:yes stop_codon:yes gene_type:complete